MRGLAITTTLIALGCGARSSLESADAETDGAGGEGGDPEPPPVCTPSEEVCNGVDDDCDGATDEGFGFGPVRGPFTVAVGPSFGSNAIVTNDGGLLMVTSHATSPIGASTSSFFATPIDLEGQALSGEVQVLEDAFWGPAVASSGSGRAILASCWAAQGQSRAASLAVDRNSGAPLGPPIVRSPTDRHCGAGYPAAHWTGSRHLFAWIDNSSGPVEGHEVLLDVADADGDSVAAQQLHPDGDLVNGSPSFAQRGDALALSFGVRETDPSESRLWVGGLDADGALTTAPRVLSGTPPTSFGEPRLIPRAAGGFVLLAGDRSFTGLHRVVLGAGLDGPDTLTRVDGFDDRVVVAMSVAPRTFGGSVVAASAYSDPGFAGRGFVAALDDDGNVTHLWEPDDPEEADLFGASVALVGARVFVAYRLIGQEVEIRLRELGCVP